MSAPIGTVAAKSLTAFALAAVTALAIQVHLTPISPADAVSPQHQVRQDAAIEAIGDRLTRVERVLDGLVAALVGIFITQLVLHRQTGRKHG